jgi:hypothetical protein
MIDAGGLTPLLLAALAYGAFHIILTIIGGFRRGRQETPTGDYWNDPEYAAKCRRARKRGYYGPISVDDA